MIKRRDNREVMTVISQGEGTVVMQRKHGVEVFDIRPVQNETLEVGASYLIEYMGGTVVRAQAMG